jgi:hypothetical protein
VTMNKLSTTLTKWRSWPRDRMGDLVVDPGDESVPVYTKPEMKSPEFQRRAARAMGQAPAAWAG